MKELIKLYLGKIDIIKSTVAIVSVFLLAFMAYSLVYVPIPEGNKEALYILIGIISSTVSMIAGFYYGSSKGSQKKDELIKSQSEQIADK